MCNVYGAHGFNVKTFQTETGKFCFHLQYIYIGKKYNINLVHLFVVSVGASISIISISLERRKIQKSCFLANVNVDGKHLRQIKKINIQQRLPIVHCEQRCGRWPGEEWGENEKDWVEKVGKENGGCFGKGNGGCFSCNYDRIVGAGRHLVFFYPVKGIWLIIKGSP